MIERIITFSKVLDDGTLSEVVHLAEQEMVGSGLRNLDGDLMLYASDHKALCGEDWKEHDGPLEGAPEFFSISTIRATKICKKCLGRLAVDCAHGIATEAGYETLQAITYAGHCEKAVNDAERAFADKVESWKRMIAGLEERIRTLDEAREVDSQKRYNLANQLEELRIERDALKNKLALVQNVLDGEAE